MKEETRFLWISELPPNATQQTLVELFSSYGRVLNTKIHEAGNLRGAVLSFLDTKTAAKACAASHLLNGHSLITEYCDQSGEPGLQRLKDSASSKHSDRKRSDSVHASGVNNNNNSPPSKCKAHRHEPRCRALKVWNFPDRSSDASIQSGLYHEYKKIGKVTSVQVKGEKDSRHAVISFKCWEDAEQAYEATRNGKSFFGMTLNVERQEAPGSDEAESVHAGGGVDPVADEFHDRATKTLFVGGLSQKAADEAELRDTFSRFGTILDVDIKQQGSGGSAYAFVQFTDIRSVVSALRRSDSITVHGAKVKLGFGKSQPNNCIWLGNLADSVNESFLTKHFSSCGAVRNVCINFQKLRALVCFEEVEDAQKAVGEMRNRCLAGKKLQVDFASQLCQTNFIDELVNSGQYPAKCRSNYKADSL